MQNNAPEPGKRPLVAMTPTIIYNPNKPCGRRFALGGANGDSLVSGQCRINPYELQTTVYENQSPTEYRLRFRRRNCQICLFQPGFGYDRNSKVSFGIVMASRNSDIESAKTESYYSLSLSQSLSDHMLSWLLAPVVLRDLARRAKV